MIPKNASYEIYDSQTSMVSRTSPLLQLLSKSKQGWAALSPLWAFPEATSK